jgi:hypothetical protein
VILRAWDQAAAERKKQASRIPNFKQTIFMKSNLNGKCIMYDIIKVEALLNLPKKCFPHAEPGEF